jgi:hypothetical protein
LAWRPDFADIRKTLFLKPLYNILRARRRKWAREHDEKLLVILWISSRHHNRRQTVVFDFFRRRLCAIFAFKPSNP